MVLYFGTTLGMNRRHRNTLRKLYERPTSANIPWHDVEMLFRALGAEISQRAGSRVAVVLFGEVRVFHRPHPSPKTDRGAVARIRKWLQENGVTP